ncbi:hypothetical protein [Tropicibacter sp. S64]|uniref:hypothetical protein n=1 Tax=Tropicibacter sp. S64 TaxID=3415122 RepID=UPI003C7EACD1
MKTTLIAGLALTLSGLSGAGNAAVTTYYGNSFQPGFASMMDLGYGIVDVSTYTTGTTTTTISATFSNVDFFDLPNSYVRNDDLIPNGAGVFGATNPHVGLNFLDGVNGVGVFANTFDGGRILIYDGFDGTGSLLGEAAYGSAAGNAAFNFGAITSDTLIKSAVFTCEFNSDLACGVIDPQWGTGSAFISAVPLPASGLLLGAGFGLLAMRRRSRKAAL